MSGGVPPLVARILRALFVVYVVATAVHIALVVLNEPFAYDAWNVASDTRAEPFTLGRFLHYGAFEYAHSNPRLGQWFTYLAYKLEYFAPIATPVAYLAIAFAVTTLGLARWPRWRQGRDLSLLSIAIGFEWFALPSIGMILFCRAYCANYVYGAAVQLWFLVPLRLCPSGEARMRACIAYGLAGVAAGMCNEHTGPVLLLGLGWFVLRNRRARLAWAGAIGAAIGFALIFFAPGQGHRYDDLAAKISLPARLLQRGITGNLDIFRDFVVGCAPVIGLLAIALVAASPDRSAQTRRALRFLGFALIAGSLVVATVFVSPKLGPRFYLHGCALLLAAFVGVADAALPSGKRLAPFVVLAIAASIYAAARSIPVYLSAHAVSDDRLALLAAAPRGSVVTLESYDQVDASWWFLGDDARQQKKRELLAAYFGLGGVVFRGGDLDVPLGMSDVRLVPHATISPAACLDERGGFELEALPARGLDIAAQQRAMLAGVQRTIARVALQHGSLEQLELQVEFVGAPPVLPRPRLLLGRWLPDRAEVWHGAIERPGVGRGRRVVVPTELRGQDLEIFIYRVGDPARRLGTARDEHLDYTPWRRGTYWALACRPDECFVFAASRVL